ncbi:chromatin modification-related protein EAF7-domain-containing protein [Chlamydoabsidia padenii]|nr:chromatin modification-related protein EAF7-domain-containing protein [Chlamydoabsidia padenii]
MPDIKVESREQSLPPVATPSSDGTGTMASTEWDASMELALLNAIANCKPVGLHKHFRIMCVHRKFNETSPSPCSINEIWERLGDYYGMDALDELEEEDKEEEEEEEQQHGDDGYREFSLPSNFEGDQIMSDHRGDEDTTRENSPAIERPPSRRTRTRRDVSPAVTESSVASTPEPDEGKATSSSRRGRTTRKSDAGTPEPGITRGTTSSSTSSSSRRSNRVSSSSSSSSSKSTTTRRQSKRK